MDIKHLNKFLIEVGKAGYASGVQGKKEKDGSTTITFESGPFRMHDNFFGGEPYGGREVIFFEGKAVWMMVYYGNVKEGINQKEVYKFLQKALSLVPEDMPLRGPKDFKEGEFKYTNHWQGSIENFSGEETIFKNEKEIYQAQYSGGLVDQRS